MKNLFLLFICILMYANASAQSFQLTSPNGRLQLTVETDKQLRWSLQYAGQPILLPSAIAMERRELKEGKTLPTFGHDVKVNKNKYTSVNTSFATPFYKKSEVQDIYNQLTLKCAGGYSIEFRAYDEGAAYRFVSEQNRPYIVKNEIAEFNFTQDYPALVPYSTMKNSGERYCFSFESYYDETSLTKMYVDSLAIYPLLINIGNGKKVVVMENGLEDYPGMFLKQSPNNKYALVGEFAPYPIETKISGRDDLNLAPVKRANYIARIDNPHRTFPWRTVLVTEKDTQLANNDMAQRLAPTCRINDISWIKPGKVAWEWWNNWAIEGVDFEAGINTPTYKKYIDFAKANGLEYIILDVGWSGNESLLKNLNPQIDLKELIAYGNKRNVERNETLLNYGY